MDEQHKHDVLNKIFRKPELRAPTPSVLSPVHMAVTVPPPRPPQIKKPSPIFRAMFGIGGKPFWEKYLTTLFYGPRSQGKSLHQAKTVWDILRYLDGMYRLFPELPQSIVVSNQKFNQAVEKKYMGWRLFYWESIQQLRYCPRENCWKDEYGVENKRVMVRGEHGKIKGTSKLPQRVKLKHRLHDCYMIIDDAATIIPADGWQDLPRWFRKVFAQAGHNGVHVIANIQDPLSCDINFRRYVDICFKFNKVIGNRRPEAGKPPVRFIWGIYTSREVPAEELWMYGDKSEQEILQEKLDREAEESAAKAAGQKIARVATRSWKRRFHWISRRATEIYDTLQNVPEYMPNTFEHYEIKCQDPKCDHISVRHRVI